MAQANELQKLRYRAGQQTDPREVSDADSEEGDEWTSIPTELDVPNQIQFGDSQLSDIRVAAHNIRGGLLAPGKELYRTVVCAYILRERIDIMALLDIGLPAENQNIAKQLWEHQLGPHYRVFVFPSGKPLARRGGRSHLLIGGQLIICHINSSRYTLLRCVGDDLKLGILVTTTISVTGRASHLKILSVYIPALPADTGISEDSGCLYHKAQIALREAGAVSQEPISWLTGLIRAKVTEGKCKEHRPTLVMGDFNRAPVRDATSEDIEGGELEQLVSELGLGKQWTTSIQAVNPAIYTYRSGESMSFIDHCLHTMNPTELVWGSVDQNWDWANFSDHLPIAMGVRLGLTLRNETPMNVPICKRRGLVMQFNADERTLAATQAMLQLIPRAEISSVGQQPLYSVNLKEAVDDALLTPPSEWADTGQAGSDLDSITNWVVSAAYAAYGTARFSYHESQPRGAILDPRPSGSPSASAVFRDVTGPQANPFRNHIVDTCPAY